MKGIILAGGSGTRLYPLSQIVSKQLQAVYDKPMIYYPVSTLMLMGIRDILIISTPEDIPRFEKLFGTGSQFGVRFSYVVQEKPNGLAQAFVLGKKFIGTDSVTLILGDNIFYGKLSTFRKAFKTFKNGGTIFGYYVDDPERYGVVQFDGQGRVIDIEEKPKQPKSNYAVPGFYIYDNEVVSIAENLKPSARGEYEITDVNRVYLERGTLTVETLGRGVAWLDTGTSESLMQAAHFIEIIEKRQGLKLGCPEEAAIDMGYLTVEELLAVIEKIPKCQYRDYVLKCAVPGKYRSLVNKGS
ncbi:MAG: glucose-1-phosphate thymidylyltransferase [Candidatus Raymondbacteria bacterium RifOxyA12_full_50_37]|uniref:Glucose-1-phosphate thymidylyltransferase n=1 Tax=Candidatus Raymondbacteria bacterium RIFOXYD12_FULL_49_13 TaxID=1817890 RepID=A0A1F7F191_UNCRA|nr:MAG: glucose-1-phosphate thymidylyltransferase [Candidatus Raymondbacteria bacterium RifOxyA12_full_50_37]OGJ93312.1 MAG: glucose-1-phosphate thymidylyltransferase [Candidatus Raymondbacteria bacterium RifOxyC12_full_50_8]OGJ93534.1 MAG: glucose-1-phosphate thymidylyltransferase [Candidatus Raymondbacteria bacterium RIFOXYA2_FULL_49_16]OGJ98804.1 MAG: glucose-1-phosphate thymidylyltransferase [Candidatus Raymondbacteria bacterium RIFOXYC2_FULL_50_21]OGK00333.1 MAG: glucose-1-phosphate thymid